MKRISIILLFLLIQWSVAQELFDQANQYYKEQKYQEAIDSYQQYLEQNKHHSWQIYFNLGNAYYKLNKIAPAVFYYEKAALLSPNNPSIENNLLFVQAMLVDPIKEHRQTGFDIWFYNITKVLSYDNWARLAVGFSVMALLFFVVYYFVNRTSLKRMFFSMFVITVILIPIVIGIAWFGSGFVKGYNPAVVFQEQVSLMQDPNSTTIIRQIHEGIKVNILEQKSELYYVELPDRTKGWIDKNSVKIVKQDKL